jgi:predicted nucleotidyltransferase
MLELKDIPSEVFPDNTILSGYRGSIAHGMHNPDPNSIDDIDIMSIYIAPLKYYVGLGAGRRYDKSIDKFVGRFDTVSYELRKFVNLLLKSNPNVLSMLWINEEHYLMQTLFGKRLIRNRKAFSSKLAYESFAGYAFSQLKKMSQGQVYEGYMGAKRKAIVEKYGYDLKNAAHCLRLLTMGIEFLKTGELVVFRPDAQKFLEVKNGLWTLEQVKSEAEKLFAGLEDANTNSPLTEHPKYDIVENIVMVNILDFYNLSRN